jgi:hypothetical protein
VVVNSNSCVYAGALVASRGKVLRMDFAVLFGTSPIRAIVDDQKEKTQYYLHR